MNYRYRNGFEPQWYKEENLKNKVILLEKYFLLLMIVNVVLVPLTIDKVKSYQDRHYIDTIEKEKKEKKFVESSEIKFIRFLMKSDLYDKSSYKYKDNKGTASFSAENIEEAEEILLKFKENNIKINDGTWTPINENQWKIEFKM